MCAVLLTALLAVGAGAQETGGVSQTVEKGTVVKGKAPVNPNLLKVRFPKPKSFTLKNGLTVYVLEDHRLPTVRFRLLMRAGTVFEPKAAVANMTADMLTEGTQSHDYRQIAQEAEDMGATLNAAADTENTTLTASGLSESTDRLIALMADVLLHPSFPADRLDHAKFQQTAQIAQRRTNPVMVTADLSTRIFYGGTAYGHESPKREEIQAVTRDDLVSFYNTYYRPNSALLGVTGDVNARDLKSKLETALADWKPAPQTAELPKADLQPKETTRVYLVDRPGSAQTVLAFGNLAVRQSDPDYIPLVVANRILGGGSSGRLFQNIREQKGYTYGAYSNIGASPWPALWSASASVRTPVTEPAAIEFFREFDRLQDETVSEAELERAKRSIIGGFALTLESPDQILSRTLDLVQNGLPLDYWDTYPQRIQAVTAADVQRVARKYLGKNHLQVIAVGERSQIEAGLKQFGPIEIVDVSQLGGGGGRRRGRGGP
ncbi:MAG TPA: pitrilysin family protein [Chthonomonadaceae bacterium]|nr:pitrilysin family protein [Chthonomonadaceae bacterium]